MNHTTIRSDLFATRAVNRAIGEARRGVPVVILGPDSERALALVVETATQGTLQEFLAAASDRPVFLMVASRAADLASGVASGAQGGAAELTIVALPAETGRLDVATLRAMANPTLAQTALPAGAAETSHVPAELQAAGLALAKLARLLPAVLMAGTRQTITGLLDVPASAVLAYPATIADSLAPAAEARVPLAEAEDTRIVAFRPQDGGIEHLAILIGRPDTASEPLVRVHSECFTGDLLGSRRCDCGPQLHQAIARMEAEGAGVILYMAQEGRGIGLVNKLRAYTLQDRGLDTLDANRALGYGADERSFAAAAAMLRSLGFTRIRLLTNNPAKIAGLSAHGIEVTGRLSHAIAANGENDAYLETKARRFGHLPG